MKTCILTVIKNEHLYLDEWIKYHLDIGVDHLFIFEDIDSGSHKAIADKYGDKVSLDNISNLYQVEEQKDIIEQKINPEMRKLGKNWLQIESIKRGLKYLKQYYSKQFDWCFVIDVDEFITLQSTNNSLSDILTYYQSYDAVILWWKCFGASGNVYCPDYSKKGVIETYIEPIKGFINNNPQFHCKVCYKLQSFDETFHINNHQVGDDYNWCNTIFKKERKIKTYQNFYIRHYITKSWEEYVWKKKIRGFFYGYTRTFDFFFKANPDMVWEKTELMKIAENISTLVILPYKQINSQGEELKIALKAWKKFCKFNYHFVVAGSFDIDLIKEFPWVEFLKVEDLPKKAGQYNPHLDMLNKMKAAYDKYKTLYNGFIYMVDDNYAIKDFNLEDIKAIHYHSLEFTGNEKSPTWFWRHNKWKTRQLLDKEGLPHINYTTHFPYYMEFDKLKEICEKYNMLEESYVFDDVYFNYFPHERPILDSTIRLGIWNKEIYKNEFQKAIDNPNIKFICNSVEGWSKELENSLEEIIC